MRPEAEHSIVFIVDRLIFFHPKTTLSNLQRAKFEFLEDTLQKSIKQKNWNRKKNRRKKRKCKESSSGNFLAMVNPVFFARPLFSKRFSPQRSTNVSRVQFKPIKNGENLVGNYNEKYKPTKLNSRHFVC